MDKCDPSTNYNELVQDFLFMLKADSPASWPLQFPALGIVESQWESRLVEILNETQTIIQYFAGPYILKAHVLEGVGSCALRQVKPYR